MKQGKVPHQKLDEIEERLSRILNRIVEKKGAWEKPLIFTGPSLSPQSARQWIDAEFRPPIARGDLPEVVQRGFRWIGIVDGVFHQSLAVSIQEIRTALESGARIYGSSSMGALRAAEAYPLGMVGVGRIYQWYREEKIDSDDEVAVSFDPDTLKSLSIPLVNLRASLERLKSFQLLDEKEERELLKIAVRLPFPERTYDKFFFEYEKVSSQKAAQHLRQLLNENEVDLKAVDAQELLRRMQSDYVEAYSSRDG